jgi:hypothetical protein
MRSQLEEGKRREEDITTQTYLIYPTIDFMPPVHSSLYIILYSTANLTQQNAKRTLFY